MAAKSSQTEITRLSDARDKIRSTLVNWGKAEGTERLDALATTIENIKNNGSVSAQIKEGDTYTIPEGYHNGSGTVSGIAGGGEYNLQSKTVTPTKKQQNVTPDEGYYGLSDVTVAAIPANYQDVSATTATAPDVLANKVFTAKDGTTTTGEMPNNGAVNQKLTAEQPSYTVPKGYHDGLGTVSVDLETKSATPTKIQQTISPTTGKLLSSVTVEAIPDEYITTDDATATAEHILEGDTAYVGGNKLTGTMSNNSAVTGKVSINSPSYSIPKGYHDGRGTISIDPETKTTTPTKSVQKITPTEGKVLSEVTVQAIPTEYITTTDATATADKILIDETAYVAGEKVTGTMPNNGSSSKTLDTTTTSYTIPLGYHDGTGSVSIVTETKTLTPTKQQQVVPATSGKVISSVTVEAIPGNYIDTTDATATAATILDGETAYVGGVKVEGSMPNNGAAEKTLTTTETSYTIPEGYHNGEGTVIIVPEQKTVQPSRSEQNVTPTTGKVLSKVTVGAIPANLIDTTDANAEASHILITKSAYVNGKKVDGTMPNNETITGTIDGLTETSYTIPAGYTAGGTVTLTDDIEQALAAI